MKEYIKDMNTQKKQSIDEKSNSEEWGAWKFVSDMLDDPHEVSGIYKTSECYEQIHDFVVEQKKKATQQAKREVVEEMIELSNKIEMSEPDGGTKQWMAFKHFRNTMRDRLLITDKEYD